MVRTRLERQGSPTGVKKWLFRAPIALYRARLGFLMGSRFLMLEHTGRRSGETRRTVLEVVSNQPEEVFVAAAWGEKAHWYKNLQADPLARFFLGTRVFETEAKALPSSEAQEVMRDYASRHPKALDRLSRFMFDNSPESPSAQADAVAESIPLVSLPKGRRAATATPDC